MGKGYSGNPSGGFSSIGGSGGGVSTNLLDDQVPKYDLGTDALVYSGATVDPTTLEWTFDHSINVPQASITIGELATLSEGGGFAMSSNPLTSFNFALVDTRFDNFGSFPPRYMDLGEAVNQNIFPGLTETITTNPLTFNFTPFSLGQTNAFTFFAGGSNINVRMRLTDNTTGEILKYIPSRVAWDTGVGGIDFVVGGNTIDFIATTPSIPNRTNLGVTPFRLGVGDQVDVEIQADNINLMGNVSDEPFLDSAFQPGRFVILGDQSTSFLAAQRKVIFFSQLGYLNPGSIQGPSVVCRDDENDSTLSVSEIAIDISVSGPGGLQTGSVEAADTWYGIYVIGDTVGSNPDNVLLIPDGTVFSESGYDKKRLIGWARNNSASDFYKFYTEGKGNSQLYIWDLDDESEVVTAGGATTFVDVDCSEFIPPTSILGLFQLGIVASASFAGLSIRTNGGTGDGSTNLIRPGIATTFTNRSFGTMITDFAQLIEYEVINAADDAYIRIQGFKVEI